MIAITLSYYRVKLLLVGGGAVNVILMKLNYRKFLRYEPA